MIISHLNLSFENPTHMNAAETAATSVAFESVANENENTTDLYCVIVH